MWFTDPLRSSSYRIFMLGDDLAVHRNFTAEMDRAARLPYWQGRDRLQHLEKDVSNNPGGALTAWLFPAVGSVMEAATLGDARRDVARIGLALYAYRAKMAAFLRSWTIWPPITSRRCRPIRLTASR